ncbi:MAG: MFS transporter [Pseudomonadota bacterium]
MTRTQIGTLAICAGIFALGQFHRASGSVFAPILMDRLAVPASAIGLLVSAMFFANIAVQLPFGAALDRFGARRVLPMCLALIAVGTALFALAGGMTGLLAARIVMGAGMAAMGAASHVIIAQAFPARDFGYATGLVATLGGIGGLLGTWPLAVTLSALPWTTTFLALAALTALGAACLPLVIAPGARAAATPGGFAALLAIPHYRRILVLGFVTYAPITTITGLWGGPYLQDALGLTPQGAGAVLFVLFGATIAAGFVFGLLDRRVRARTRLIAAGVCGSVLCLALLAALPAPPVWLACALLLGSVFCQQFYIPLGADMRATVPAEVLGRASALLALVAVSAIPLLQLGFGAVLDITSAWSTNASFGAAFGAMAALISLCAGVYFSGGGRPSTT